MTRNIKSVAIMKKFLLAGKSTTAGFSLIEILIAMVIFAIAVLGLAAGTASVIQANQKSYLRTAAINLAQTQLEQLKGMSAGAFASVFPPASCPCSDTDNPVSAGKSFNRTWVVTYNSPIAGVNRIDVTVTWTDYANQTVVVSSSVPQ